MRSLYVELSSAYHDGPNSGRDGPKRVEDLKPSLIANGLEMYFLQEVALDPTVFRCRD